MNPKFLQSLNRLLRRTSSSLVVCEFEGAPVHGLNRLLRRTSSSQKVVECVSVVVAQS